MIVPKGSKVTLEYHTAEDDQNSNENVASITASLEEDLQMNLSSQFSPLVGNNESTMGSLIGGVLNAFNSDLGGSTQFKQMGFQIWQKTEPIGLSLTLGFYRKLNAANEIRSAVRTLLKMPLPGERSSGMLIPPGPSVLEAIGWPKKIGRSSVNLTVGGITIRDLILKQAEPSYSKYQDSSGYPIWVKVACQFITMFTGTQKMVDSGF